MGQVVWYSKDQYTAWIELCESRSSKVFSILEKDKHQEVEHKRSNSALNFNSLTETNNQLRHVMLNSDVCRRFAQKFGRGLSVFTFCEIPNCSPQLHNSDFP